MTPPRDTSVYVSVDVEADGPIPGPHSMVSFGAAAFSANGVMLGTHAANLVTLPGASGHPETMAWWRKHDAAWKACRENTVEPADAMRAFVDWVDGVSKKPVFVAYPAGFDFTFMYWYLMKFVGRSPFSFAALDVKSYAAALLRTPFRDTAKRTFPKSWFSTRRHTHVALDDAIEQGEMFMKMLAEARGTGSAPEG
jgi:DNA polymerase III alpha subunit (gram-positive type)